jgi:HTH-type transcriptional repressor of NAD biosynthesis genes
MSQYQSGLVVGKFYPLHHGHQFVIQSALASCDHVWVVMTEQAHESISGPVRLDWIKKLYPQVTAVLLPKSTPNLPEECQSLDAFYAVWQTLIIEHCGLMPEAMFTSEDYGDECQRFWNTKHVCVDKARALFPVSGTAIRNDPFENWRYLDPVVQASFIKTVCLYGPESTGKSTLGEKLARHYGTVCQPEWAREYLGARHCEYEDMAIIAEGHFSQRAEFKKRANKVMFVDTDTLITRTFSQHYYGKCPPRVDQIVHHPENQNDLYLFTSIDVPWVADTSRDLGAPEIRMNIQAKLQSALREHESLYVMIEYNDWESRFTQAVSAVDRFIFQKHGSERKVDRCAGP